MSDSTPAQSSPAPSQSGTEDNVVINHSPEELARRLKETAEEAKKYRQKNAEFQARFEAIENERLAEQGKWKEIAEQQKARADKAEKEAKEKHAKFALRTVESQVKAEAAKRGCVDSDALLKLMDISELDVDDDYSVNGTTMASALEKLQKEKPYLFPKQAASHRDLPPNSGKEGFKEKSLSEMTIAEKKEFLQKSFGK